MTGSVDGARMSLPASAWAMLERDLAASTVDPAPLRQALDTALARLQHGDLPRWLAALDALPEVSTGWEGGCAAPRLGGPGPDPEALRDTLMSLHPWRKGPLELGGETIDTEWRSDWKWDRLVDHLELEDATVLDVGCGNGYFGWRMLAAGARCVIGIDPTVLFVMQWLAQRHFAGPAPNYVLPLRDTDLPDDTGGFDLVCSMGVLYHRRDPGDHLQRLFRALRPGGTLVLETLIIEGEGALHPPGRYARMRNVHELPSVPVLEAQLRDSGFQAVRLVDQTYTTVEEQRSTQWMQFESLAQCLDPADSSRTIEGHPAPLRGIVLARRP